MKKIRVDGDSKAENVVVKLPPHGTPEYYKALGSRGGKKGGKAKVRKGFAVNPELARRAGSKSKRPKQAD